MGISPRRSGRSAASSSSSAPHHHGSGSSHGTNPPASPRKRRNSLQSHNPSPPPLEADSQERDVASPRDPAMDDDEVDDVDADDDDEEDDDDASAEITRCVCGQQEYPFPDADVEDTGFMICCERCNVWQHGPCVGVMSENEAPDVYFCEECRPDLHELGNRSQGSVSVADCADGRIKQTRWIGGPNPLQSTRRKKSTTLAPPAKHEDPIPSPDPSDTAQKERKPSPKKRSTMNSRDAAYDYSALFTPQLGPQTEEESKMDEGSPPPGRGRSRRGKRLAEDDEEERGSKRRRESDNSENEPTKTRKKRGANDSDSKNDESASELPGIATPLLEAPPRNGGKRGGYGGKRRGGHAGAKMERVDSEEPPMTPTTLRRFGEEMMKPARARIPQARSGLNEMRKRVGAILEYVGRLQLEAQKEANANGSPTPWNGSGSPIQTQEIVVTERQELTADEIVEGEYEKPDLETAPSMLIMQYLTKRCLEFEVKFGKYPGRYP